MRILLSTNLAWNIANFRLPLIAALVEAGHEVATAAAADGYEDRIAAAGIAFHPLPIEPSGMSPLQDLRLLREYRRVFRLTRPDAYLGYTIKPNIYGSIAAHLAGCPTINNISGLGKAFMAQGGLQAAVRRFYALALRPAFRVFFQNAEDAQMFTDSRIVAASKVGLLPGSGVDLLRFAPAAPREGGDPVRFLYVGRMLVEKGIEELATAARLVRESGRRAEVALLGFADDRHRSAVGLARIRRWEEEGLVRYLGPADDVRPFLRDCDAVVLPSYREGLPRSLLEAAATARPLIASDVPGCRSLVIDGENGLLHKARDAASLAAALIRFCDLPGERRAHMGRASRSMVERGFAQEFVFKAYLETLEACKTGSMQPSKTPAGG